MDFLMAWINIIYAALLWAVVLILVRPERIKELLPSGVVAAFLLFIVEYFLISLGLIHFNKGVFMAAGIPLFNPIWGAAAGILVMNYMKREFSQKIMMIVFFTVIVEISTYVAIKVKNISFIGGYNFAHDIIVSFVMLMLLTHISEGLFGKQIYKHKI